MKGDGKFRGHILYTRFKKRRGKWKLLKEENHWCKFRYFRAGNLDIKKPEEQKEYWNKIKRELWEAGNPATTFRRRAVYSEKGFRKGSMSKPFQFNNYNPPPQ